MNRLAVSLPVPEASRALKSFRGIWREQVMTAAHEDLQVAMVRLDLLRIVDLVLFETAQRIDATAPDLSTRAGRQRACSVVRSLRDDPSLPVVDVPAEVMLRAHRAQVDRAHECAHFAHLPQHAELRQVAHEEAAWHHSQAWHTRRQARVVDEELDPIGQAYWHAGADHDAHRLRHVQQAEATRPMAPAAVEMPVADAQPGFWTMRCLKNHVTWLRRRII